jgi:hypothetical protein
VTYNVLPFRQILDGAKALEIIREACFKGLGWPDSALAMMIEREISSVIVKAALARGTLKEGPTWNELHQDWVCKVQFTSSGRRLLVTVGVVLETREVSVVAAY